MTYSNLVVREGEFNVVASSDWHIRADEDQPRYMSVGQAIDLVKEMHSQGDVIVNCGDITDYEPEQGIDALTRSARAAALVFRESSRPKYAVLGNHDHEGDQSELVKRILEDEGGVKFLQENYYVEQNGDLKVGFVGVKGLGGGFGRYAIPHFGERVLKAYREEMDWENATLFRSLDQVDADNVFVALHYSPIRETIKYEGAQLFHALGNSGLEKAINSHHGKAWQVTHGHAHLGKAHGLTEKGIPVDNVSMQVLKKERQDKNEEFIPGNLFNTYSIPLIG